MSDRGPGIGGGVAAGAGFAGTEVFLYPLWRGRGRPGGVVHHRLGPQPHHRPRRRHLLPARAPGEPLPAPPPTRSPAGDTKRYDNAVETLFGVETFGALRITSNVRIVVGSRIYSQPGTAIEDSTGQYFAAVPASFAIGAGESTEVIGGWQTQPAAGSAFRFNYGSWR